MENIQESLLVDNTSKEIKEEVETSDAVKVVVEKVEINPTNVKNIYQKLMKVRTELHNLELKKSGKNAYSGYSYYDLGDFLVPATALLEKEGLCTFINFTETTATLTLINGDEPSQAITFTSPIKAVEMKGANYMQSLGATQTYATRYLYVQLLAIVEADSFDLSHGERLKELEELRRKMNLTEEKLNNMTMTRFNQEYKKLTDEKLATVITGLTETLYKEKEKEKEKDK